MLANSLVKLSSPRTIFCQQVRFARKTYRLKSGYGISPILTDDQYNQHVENNTLNDLSFKQVRFARSWEVYSPLYDEQYERFVRYVMKDGRMELARTLVDNTFYELKALQFARLRKRQAKDAAKNKVKTSNDDDDDDEEEDVIEMNPLEVFKQAWKNAEPIVVTKNVRRGGAIYQVPFPISQEYSTYLGLKWLIKATRDRPKRRVKLFPEVMARELLDASLNRGKVIKKRDDIHKLADANKAYAHYRWG